MVTQTSQRTLLSRFAKYVSMNILGMIGLSCYILADTFFIARGLGANGLTALNLAIPVYSVIHGLGLMVGMGGATRYAILSQNANKKTTNRIFTQSALLALLLSVFFVVAGIFFTGALSRILGADESVYAITCGYLRVILLFSPLFMLNNVLICFVRNDGNPQLGMLGMLLGSLSNIILDYFFIFPLNMGMFGAALATGIAPVVSMAVLSLHFALKKNKFCAVRTKLVWSNIRDICTLGSSSLITELSSGISMLVFNMILLRLKGNLGVAAYGIIANLALVALSIFTGIGQGIQPLLSEFHGRNQPANVRKVYRYGLIVSLCLSVLIYCICCPFAGKIVSWFNRDGNAALAQIAVNGMWLYFIGFVFAGINVVSSIYFSSTEHPASSLAISLMRGLIVLVPMAFVLSRAFGISGVWLSFPVTELFVLIAAFVLLHRTAKDISVSAI